MFKWWRCLLCGGWCSTKEKLHSHITGPTMLHNPRGKGHGVREELWENYAYEMDLEVDTSFMTNSAKEGDP